MEFTEEQKKVIAAIVDKYPQKMMNLLEDEEIANFDDSSKGMIRVCILRGIILKTAVQSMEMIIDEHKDTELKLLISLLLEGSNQARKNVEIEKIISGATHATTEG